MMLVDPSIVLIDILFQVEIRAAKVSSIKLTKVTF